MARAFADVLRELGGGQTYEELGSAMADIVQEVITHRKGGELTLKLKIKPNGENSVLITDDIKVKVPQGTRGETVFFAGGGGTLQREDPRQQRLPLRTVPGTAAADAAADATEKAGA